MPLSPFRTEIESQFYRFRPNRKQKQSRYRHDADGTSSYRSLKHPDSIVHETIESSFYFVVLRRPFSLATSNAKEKRYHNSASCRVEMKTIDSSDIE